MKATIGIISYLPQHQPARDGRRQKLVALIKSCNWLFGIGISIVAQGWEDEDIELIGRMGNVSIVGRHQKLGIVGARKALREWFLGSGYTHLIMLDDDCVLKGTKESGSEYLRQIRENSGCFMEFNGTLLKLFCIPRDLMAEVDYPDMSVENGDGFEDRMFVGMLRKRFPDRRAEFTHNGLEEMSMSSMDPLSTWYSGQDLGSMLKQTDAKLSEWEHPCAKFIETDTFSCDLQRGTFDK